MTSYEDDVLVVDDDGITVKNWTRPGRAHRIPLSEVESSGLVKLGRWNGRWRLVGVGPFSPRNFYHWDARRTAKTTGIRLNVQGVFRPVLTPDEPHRALEVIRRHTAAA